MGLIVQPEVSICLTNKLTLLRAAHWGLSAYASSPSLIRTEVDWTTICVQNKLSPSEPQWTEDASADNGFAGQTDRMNAIAKLLAARVLVKY